MIDIHSHILPGIDDGSPDLETSLAALERMEQAGVTDVFATSHFIRGNYNTCRTLIDSKHAELTTALRKKGLKINVHTGAEVLMAPNTVDDVVKETLVYQNTDYVLVESEINSLPPNMADLFYKLNLKGYHPVFAHPERYAPFQRQPERIEELVHQSVYLQVNAGSLLGGYGHRIADVAWGLVEAGFAHFVASDTHCHSDNYPLAAAAEMIRDRIDERTARLLTEENPRKLLHNEDIDYVYLRFVPEKHRTFWQRLGDAMWNR